MPELNNSKEHRVHLYVYASHLDSSESFGAYIQYGCVWTNQLFPPSDMYPLQFMQYKKKRSKVCIMLLSPHLEFLPSTCQKFQRGAVQFVIKIFVMVRHVHCTTTKIVLLRMGQGGPMIFRTVDDII